MQWLKSQSKTNPWLIRHVKNTHRSHKRQDSLSWNCTTEQAWLKVMPLFRKVISSTPKSTLSLSFSCTQTWKTLLSQATIRNNHDTLSRSGTLTQTTLLHFSHIPTRKKTLWPYSHLTSHMHTTHTHMHMHTCTYILPSLVHPPGRNRPDAMHSMTLGNTPPG